MTQASINYQINPRFVPDDLPLWLGNAKDSAVIYDATADELTLQTQNASAVLTDRIRVESGINTPFVEFVAGKLRFLDAAADPGAAGEVTRNGADLKVYSGGALRNLSNVGSGISNVVEDTTPQLGGNLDVNGQTILFDDNENLTFGTGSDATIRYDGTNLVINPRAVGGGNVLINAGSIDLNNQGSLLNVGAAGNDWTQTSLTLSGGAATQVITVQTTGTTGNVQSRIDIKIPASSTNTTARLRFIEGDGTGSAGNMGYEIGYIAENAWLSLNSHDTDGSSTDADIWRIPDGQTTIDANTTWDANVFDNYDDALVLSPYREGVMNMEQRQTELIRMGVLRQYKDGWVGYNDQRMAALLAGGIYQNRARIDRNRQSNQNTLTQHKSRLFEQDRRIESLKQQVNTVQAELAALRG